jgi:hypothetical protein
MDLAEIGCVGVAQDMAKWRALVNAVMNLRVIYNFGKLKSGNKTDGLSSSAQLQAVS